MRMTILCLGIWVAMSTAHSQSRVVPGAEPPWPPPSGIAHLTRTLPPGYMPQSMKELCDRSAGIADATVETIFPPREVARHSLETDVGLIVRQVIKGDHTLKYIVVSQRGGTVGQFSELPTQYHLMKVGERYIIFLEEDKRLNLPLRDGHRRFGITAQWLGLFYMDPSAQAVHLMSDTPRSLRDTYEGMALAQVIMEITNFIRP